MLAKYQPNANLRYSDSAGKAILHYITKDYSDSKDQSKKARMGRVMVLLILLFNADLTIKDNKGKTPLDYVVAKLRDDINETYGATATATDFILQYFEKNSDKSIEDCVEHFLENLNQLANNTPHKRSRASSTISDSKVEGISKEDREFNKSNL